MAPRRRPAPTDGPRVAKFWETYCSHVKGFRGPLIAEPWQRSFLDLAFEIDPRTGLRVFREVLLGIPRGNSKSTSCAGIGLYMLLADDEPGPIVLSAAGKKEQAREVHGVAHTMAKRNVDLAELLDTANTDEIRSPENDGVWGIITSSGELEQGSNPSCGVIDELHVHKDGSTYNAVYSGAIAKRQQPLILSITTAGTAKDTFAGEVYDRMLALPSVERPSRFLQVAQDRENGVLMVWYGIPDDELKVVDLDDPAVWAGCNPASWVTEQALKSARNSPFMDETQFIRFHCNGWLARSGQGGIDSDDLEAAIQRGAGLEWPEGSEVVVGADAGWRDDWTAVAQVGRVGDLVAVELDLFPPSDGMDVDLDEAVVATTLQIGRRMRVRELAADQSSIQSILQSAMKAGIPTMEYPQNTGHKVRRSLTLDRALRQGTLAIVRATTHTPDGSRDGMDDLRDHFLNARKIDTRDGDWYFDKPLKPGTKSVDRSKKIDGLVAVSQGVDIVVNTGPDMLEEHGLFI